MAARNHEELLPLVRAALLEQGPALGLGRPLRVRYRFNPGGFCNANFTALCGGRVVHIKLTLPRSQPSLRRQVELGGHLCAHYRAPRVLGWLEVEPQGHAGLVLQHLPGRPLTRRAMRAVLPAVARCVAGLHADHWLQARLPQGPRVNPELDVMVREALALPRPAFISRGLHGRLRKLADAVLADLHALGQATFERVPIHADIWEQNILVTPGGRWGLIDWDGLSLGDPAADWAAMALMLGPGLTFDQAAPRLRVPIDSAVADRAARFHACMKFAYAVDSIADWHDAEKLPSRAAKVRAIKERQFAHWMKAANLA